MHSLRRTTPSARVATRVARAIGRSWWLAGLAACRAGEAASTPADAIPSAPVAPATHLVFSMRGADAGEERVRWLRTDAGHHAWIETELVFPRDVRLRTRLELDAATQRVRAISTEGTPYPWQRGALELRLPIDTPAGRTRIDAPVPAASPFPVALQALLVAEWERQGRPRSMRGLPEGEVLVEPCGTDRLVLEANASPEDLRCYAVAGLTWGRSLLWLTADGRMVGAVVPTAFAPLVATVPSAAALHESLLDAAARRGVALARPERAAEPRADSPLALVGVRVIVGDDTPPLEHGTVVVRGGAIAAVGARASTPVPADARVIDGAGLTVLPGLWDMHAHLKQAEWLPAYLASGVTTVRDLGNEPAFLLALRDAAVASGRVSPRILAAGLIDAAPRSGRPYVGEARQANAPASGRALVRRHHRGGFEQIKVWNNVRPAVLQAITAEAHALGLTVVGHVPGGLELLDAVRLGLDEVSHVGFVTAAFDGAPPESAGARRVVDSLRRAGVVVDPTLVVTEYGTRSRATPLAAIEPCARTVPAELVRLWDGFATDPADAAAGARELDLALRTVRALHEAGVPIVAGTDQGIPGCTLARELELYVRAGLSPLDAIRSATSVPARVTGRLAEVGTIAPGKRADLLLVAGDPSRDIRALRAVRRVVVGGVVLAPEELRRLAYPATGGSAPERDGARGPARRHRRRRAPGRRPTTMRGSGRALRAGGIRVGEAA